MAALSGCIAVPRAIERPPGACPLVTRALVLDTQGSLRGLCNNSVRAEHCLQSLVLAGTVGAASVVVSGSIVLVGNTLHWLETSARCPGRSEAADEQR